MILNRTYQKWAAVLLAPFYGAVFGRVMAHFVAFTAGVRLHREGILASTITGCVVGVIVLLIGSIWLCTDNDRW